MSGLVPQSNPELESTPNQDTEDEPTLEPQLCECGEEIKDDNQLCKNCKSLADLGEDPVEPQSVTTDESSSWLLDQLFEELPSNKCACGNNLDNGKCDKCEQLNDSERLVTEPKQTNYVDIGTQVDVSAEFPDENLDELSQTMHICQDDNCECGEEEVLSELDKSVQVSEVALLLNDTKEKLESEDSLENENDPVNEKDPEKDSDCEEKSRSSPDHVAVKPVVHDEVAAELIYDEVQKQADEDYFEKLNKICRTCNQERDYTKSEAGECLCSKDQSELDLDNEDTSNKSDPDKTADKSVLHESTLPDYSDMTSNYTERDTDIRTQNTEHPSDVDSLAMAARHRAGMPIAVSKDT